MIEAFRDTAGEMARLEAVDFLRMGFIGVILHNEVTGALVLFALTAGVLILDRAVCVATRKVKAHKQSRGK